MIRHPRNLVVFGLVWVVLGGLQALVTDTDSAAYGMATGGALVMATGAVVWASSRK